MSDFAEQLQIQFNELISHISSDDEKVKNSRFEFETIAINPDEKQFFTSKLPYRKTYTSFPDFFKKVDKNIYNKTLELLERQNLSEHVDNVCYILKRAYIQFLNFHSSEYKSFLRDFGDLFNRIDKSHEKIKIIGSQNAYDINISNRQLLKFIKKALIEGIINNPSLRFDLLKNITMMTTQRETGVYQKAIYNLCVYFTERHDLLPNRLAFEIIYNILESVGFLSSELLEKRDKFPEDKYRYIHRTYNEFVSQLSNKFGSNNLPYTFDYFAGFNSPSYLAMWEEANEIAINRIEQINSSI